MSPPHSVSQSSQGSVSVLGLGLMGNALARALIQNGWKTSVWNRTAAKAEPIVHMGGILAATPAECIQASELTIFCLLDQQAVHEILGECDANCGHGRIVVDFTSGIVSDNYRSQQLAASKSFSAYVRGAIEAIPQSIGLPESILYYSGDATAFKKAENCLKVFGTSIYLGSDVSLASVQEAILGTCFYFFGVGFLQSIALLKTSKLWSSGGAENFTTRCVIPFLTEQLPVAFLDMAKEIDKEDYATKGSVVTVNTLASSLRALMKFNVDQGIPTSAFEPMLRLMEARAEQGGGGDGMASLINVFGAN
ncbi:hypothetical protein H2204_005109 [Knufia peltigerae]|uniref:6-phosphogluconate dehydrogenase NADP-binding domain-containing protein n=1 Tax=Knufia peltigerae TaxID=1002370 RepID=A0AA38Y690_9EURO|nr:hypothetical protein H2204_005109 [Knufia peltigerae]